VSEHIVPIPRETGRKEGGRRAYTRRLAFHFPSDRANNKNQYGNEKEGLATHVHVKNFTNTGKDES